MCKSPDHIITHLQEVLTKSSQDDILAPLEQEAQKQVADMFEEQGNIFMELFTKKREFFSEALTPDDAEDDISRMFGQTERRFQDVIKGILVKAFTAGASNQIEEVTVGISFNLENPRAQEWVQKRAGDMIKGINETTRKRIKNIIEDSFENKWTYNETAKAIKSRFKEFAGRKPQQHIQSRAHLVAVTENAEAFGQGNMEAVNQMEEAGILMEKFWSNTGDGNVSEGCLNNTAAGWIPVSQPFPSGHMREGRFPGCRCKVLYRRLK